MFGSESSVGSGDIHRKVVMHSFKFDDVIYIYGHFVFDDDDALQADVRRWVVIKNFPGFRHETHSLFAIG